MALDFLINCFECSAMCTHAGHGVVGRVGFLPIVSDHVQMVPMMGEDFTYIA